MVADGLITLSARCTCRSGGYIQSLKPLFFLHKMKSIRIILQMVLFHMSRNYLGLQIKFIKCVGNIIGLIEKTKTMNEKSKVNLQINVLTNKVIFKVT